MWLKKRSLICLIRKKRAAAGFDKISVKLIIIILPLIIDPLITIYNKSLKESIFPTQFTVAIVKPIFKKVINNHWETIDPF